MGTALAPTPLPDAAARLAALTDHNRTLLVEAGAGSGKTALIAGRVALLLSAGIHPGEIVAITFTEASAAELLERIQRFVHTFLGGQIPVELQEALPLGLTQAQYENLESGARSLDEIGCTTIHGFCQQLVKPYPVEAGIDPGAAIIDPAAAALTYQDLVGAWLSARFGRDRSAEGLGRIPAIQGAGGEDDFFSELLVLAPDATLNLIEGTARFLKSYRTATAGAAAANPLAFSQFADTVARFADWYNTCSVCEDTTGTLIEDLARVAEIARRASAGPLTGRRIAELLFHTPPQACKQDEIAFRQWGRKGKWKDAAKANGRSTAQGEQLSAAGEAHYGACAAAYENICASLSALAFRRFVAEFDALRSLYREYKRNAALLDFDDLLHHARDLLRDNEAVRRAIATRYPWILVDEFQDTDPLQAEILWRLAGEGAAADHWEARTLRPGALFLVGDPKQAIYRFRGADVGTYLVAKNSISTRDSDALLEITANFRSQAAILEFVNAHFSVLLDASQAQPGFTALTPVRISNDEPSVAAYEVRLDDSHRNDKGKLIVDLVRREEAAIVADIARHLIGTYPVWDKATRSVRPARAGDIALLAPAGTSLWIYERALEALDIPIATQAGKGFFRRQEVQDLIAVARAIADRRDTLALGALLRGPLVGLTEEQIADEIDAFQNTAETAKHRLHLWTDLTQIQNSILKQTLATLQNLARKARSTTPYHLLAEAVEELQVRPLLKARHPRGAERSLANVELVLEMARPYAARGIADFARAMWERWEDEDAQSEGRPDAEADAVSIITIHSAKGLEWPIVIPINTTTSLRSDARFLYRRRDDSVHFKVFDFPSPNYEDVAREEGGELERERVRLWYVALTRARDLLLLPRQTERVDNDWFSLVNLDITSLPSLDLAQFSGSLPEIALTPTNRQDLATWEREAATIAASERRITWHQPSGHDVAMGSEASSEEVFVGPDPVQEVAAEQEIKPTIQGGRERGLILHKLMEEVLSGEVSEGVGALRARAVELLAQLGYADAADAADGPSSAEMASCIQRGLQLPEVLMLRPFLLPEFRVYAGVVMEQRMTLTAGIADAVAISESGLVEAVIDWKSDVDPKPEQIEAYREQVRDYLAATGAPFGLIVFLTSNRVERVERLS